MAKQKSRPVRWNEAVGEARDAYNSIMAAADELQAALSELGDLRAEYEEWRENLSENLESSPVAEKLDAILELDFENVQNDPLDNWNDVESILDEAEGAELPLGFGRD